MKQLYFFSTVLNSLDSNIYGRGFMACSMESEDDNYFYFDKTNRVCKKTHKVEYKSMFTNEYGTSHCERKFYPTKELWEKAKSDYFAKLLSDNEADKQKILKSMEGY